MKKTVRLLALLLSALLLFCSCELPFLSDGESAAESEETADGLTQSTEDSSESSAPATTDAPDTPKEPAVKVKTIKIYNAGQLMSLLELSRAEDYATTSKNTVYQLQCDIDLNEGWNGSMGDNGAVPELPSNVWTGIEKFYGTLDGNGHAIRGIYMYANIESAASMVSIAMKNADLYATIREEAHLDHLTNLYNRRYFTEKVGEIVLQFRLVIQGAVQHGGGVNVPRKAVGEKALTTSVLHTAGHSHVL